MVTRRLCGGTGAAGASTGTGARNNVPEDITPKTTKAPEEAFFVAE